MQCVSLVRAHREPIEVKTGGHNEARKSTPDPRVSVIIPAYNAGRTLRACLQSVHESEYNGAVEVIVVDDRSTDNTCTIAEGLRCVVIRRSTNGGPALARNAGANAALGEILFFLDADTQMRPDTIREAVRVLQRWDVGAVTGMYEAEPIRPGFFQRYYAYLKYHTFTASDVDHITAFGGQCGAVYKDLFERVGGYRPIQWGVDIENEELGFRMNRISKVALGRTVRVRHHFPGFRKLLFIFTSRVYWWVLFSRFSKQSETVLMTRGFGYATAALPAAALLWLASFAVPADIAFALVTGAALLAALFVRGYLGFWRFCLRRRGPAFAFAAAIASALFSIVVTTAAAYGHLTATWYALRRRDLPFVQSSLRPA